TSAGAPCWIWVTSVGLPAKLNLTSAWRCRALNWDPTLPKASVSEAAASTVSFRLTGSPEGLVEDCEAAPPQADSSSGIAAAAANGLLRMGIPSLLEHDHVVGFEHGSRHVPHLQLQPVGGGGCDDRGDQLT